MNSFPLKPQKSSKIEQDEIKRPGLTRSLTMDTQGGSAMERLPDEVMLKIFRFLSVKQLLIAEQVCVHWKGIVDTCFATAQTLSLQGRKNDLQTMRRCGPSLKSLELCSCGGKIDWINEIVNAFPNLLSISLDNVVMSNEACKALTVKCCKVTKISLSLCDVNDAKLAILVKGLPGLKCLELCLISGDLGKCFELGSNLEELFIADCEITEVGSKHIFSKCINLKFITLCNGVQSFESDAILFTAFCKKTPLRSLGIKYTQLSKEELLSISHLSLLEELEISVCHVVDSDVLITISRGCPNLKKLTLESLDLVCDRGLKAFAQSRHLTYLRCDSMAKMTDESLIEIAKAGLLKSLVVADCDVSDHGLSAILAQCPQLTFLSVNNCGAVSDCTVDAAIQAVESRRNGSNEPSRHLLKLCLRAKGLNRYRYKKDFSHPLLFLKRWRVYN